MDAGPTPGGFDGLVRWRDLDTLREREEHARYAMEVRIMARMTSLETNAQHAERRVDSIESVLDQQRGAKALVYFLIGSNLLAVLAFLMHR